MKTRPGIDRIDKQTLTSAKGWLTGKLEAHEKICNKCKVAGSNPRNRCDTWWRNARRLHQVKRQLRQYDEPETSGMGTLPGMDDL